MGAGHSDLKSSLDRLPSLRGKPALLKDELSQFVAVCPTDANLNVKLDKKVFDIIHELFISEMADENSNPYDQMTLFKALQRFMKIKQFYQSLARADLSPYVTALRKSDPISLVAVLDCVAWMLDCRVSTAERKPNAPIDPSFDPRQATKDFDLEKEESAVKYAFYEYKGYDALCALLVKYSESSHTNIVVKVLDMLSLDLADHLSTTRWHITQRIVKMLAPHIDVLLKLTTSSSLEIRCFTIIFLTSLLLQSPLKFVQSLQEKVLKQGFILWYIMFSIDAGVINDDNPYFEYYDKSQTMLARKFLSLLCSGHAGNRSVMLGCIPVQLHGALDDPVEGKVAIRGAARNDKAKLEETLWFAFQSGQMTRMNCEHLFNNLDDEVKLPHIIWVSRMKAELLDQLRQEIENYSIAQSIHAGLTWEHAAFDVQHPYLNKFCRVGNFYVSLLIPALQDKESQYHLKVELLQQLLSALFQRAVIEDDPTWKLACMGAISTMYERYPEHFKELLIIPYYIYLLNPTRVEPIWRDHILRFMQTVLREPINAKRFVDYGGISPLLTMVNSIHSLDAPDNANIAENDDADLPQFDRNKSSATTPRYAQQSPLNNKLEYDTSDSEDDETGYTQSMASPNQSSASNYQRSKPPSYHASEVDSSPEPEFVQRPPSHPPAPPPPPPPPAPKAPAAKPAPPAPKPSPAPQPTQAAPPQAAPQATPQPPQSNLQSAKAAPQSNSQSAKAAPQQTKQHAPMPTPPAASLVSPPAQARSTSPAPLKVQTNPTSQSTNQASKTPKTPASPVNVTKPVVDVSGKPIMVLRANGPSAKSQVEQDFDWNDEPEDLRQGLPEPFPVEETAARSLRLLRIIAYCGPKLRRVLTTPELLSSLAKLLLCPLSEIREDGLRLFLDLLNTSPHVIPWLAPTGLFPCMVYSFRYGFSPLLAKLVDRTHTMQSPEFVPAGQSALAPYLPAALIAILKTEGAEGLRVAMETDMTSPEMIWNEELKTFMHNAIAHQLAPFLTTLRTQNDALFPAQAKIQPIKYSQLDSELMIGGVYLRPLAAFEPSIDQLSLRDPNHVMSQLNAAVMSHKHKDESLDLILLSSIIVSTRYRDLPSVCSYPALSELLILIDPTVPSKNSPDWRSQLAARSALLLHALLQSTGNNCQHAFEAKGVDHLGACLNAYVNTSLEDTNHLLCVIHCLDALCEILKKVPIAIKQFEHESVLLKQIVGCLSPEFAAQFPQISIAAAHCLHGAVKNDRVLEICIKKGTLVYCIYSSMFYGQSDEIDLQVRQSCIALIDSIKIRGNKRTLAILTSLLTGEVLNVSNQSMEFIRLIDSFDGEYRQRLEMYLQEQIQAIADCEGEDWREYSDNTFSFQ